MIGIANSYFLPTSIQSTNIIAIFSFIDIFGSSIINFKYDIQHLSYYRHSVDMIYLYNLFDNLLKT